MNLNRSLLKADAKDALRASKTSPYLTALIYLIIVYILGVLRSRLLDVTLDYDTFMRAMETGNYDYLIYQIQQHTPGAASRIIGMLLLLMSTMVGIGFTIFCLLTARRRPNSMGNLFDSFGNFFRFLWLIILIEIFIFLWTLLLVIPGIVASYRYRQAIYLLIDHPDMSPIDCIRTSKELMRGHKAELFMLDLSFLGWFLLTIIPFVSVYVSPYTVTTYALYYNALSGAHEGQRWSRPSDPPPSGPSRYATEDNDGLPPWEYKN